MENPKLSCPQAEDPTNGHLIAWKAQTKQIQVWNSLHQHGEKAWIDRWEKEKRDQSCKGKSNLRRELKDEGRLKKKIFKIDVSRSLIEVPMCSFNYSAKAPSALHYIMASLNKKDEMKENKVLTISRQVPQQASHQHDAAPTYYFHIAYVSQTLYLSPAVYYSQSRYHKDRPARRTRVFTPLAESLRKLQPKLLKANLVTQMQLWQSQLHFRSHNPNVRCAYTWDSPR